MLLLRKRVKFAVRCHNIAPRRDADGAVERNIAVEPLTMHPKVGEGAVEGEDVVRTVLTGGSWILFVMPLS